MQETVVVDISHYDKVTDWNKLAKSCSGVIVKATQGSFFTDSTYVVYLNKLKNTGVLVGSYHFGTNEDGAKQADRYISVVKKSKISQLLCLDFERYPKSQMTVFDAERFVARIKTEFDVYPVIYIGWDFLKELLGKSAINKDSILRKCAFWVAKYSEVGPTYIDESINITMWQFTGDGLGAFPHSVPGIEGSKVDISTWIGNKNDIPLFWQKRSNKT